MAARRPRRERHLRPVASLWIGERLRWIDRLALTALRHHGHEVTLYHAGPAPAGVPDGIALESADRIIPVDELLGRFSPALVSDVFRFALMRDTETIWVDTDAVALVPLEPDAEGYLVGAEEDGVWLNCAVLRLPPDSPGLAILNRACATPDEVPAWMPADRRGAMRKVASEDTLREACRVMPNLLGPRGLTYALDQTGEDARALPSVALNPLPWWHAAVAFNPHGGTDGWVTPQTQVVHLYASRIPPPLLRRPAPAGSLLARLAERFGLSGAPTRS